MFHTCTVDSAAAHSGHVHILYIITLRDTLTSKRATASLNSSPGHEVDPRGKLLLHNASHHLVLFCSPCFPHSSPFLFSYHMVFSISGLKQAILLTGRG
jgi:hypothetical protein